MYGKWGRRRRRALITLKRNKNKKNVSSYYWINFICQASSAMEAAKTRSHTLRWLAAGAYSIPSGRTIKVISENYYFLVLVFKVTKQYIIPNLTIGKIAIINLKKCILSFERPTLLSLMAKNDGHYIHIFEYFVYTHIYI